ncbi:tRNA lysidine(34) synthetase TilS [Lysobacter sp. 5GHs7-4]|uniref:tRNA lysidine(34) synthetase TilS n=1 Tax=Lysobacter sp. 5GHs7-4 TaxID=2904253 RepID=UPI001E390597|nr:tRNA lysidine(34) synthetase TilS [Lysobacter sp. 5GHs7-4]UHQ22021.1 tRNA lysidine(34) synthetase TilS [Lysobacter sp. 5GHs7-4]
MPPQRPALLADALRDLPQGPLCVGYSGGLDSSALLHLLAASPQVRERGLRAWHVHHGLHPRADDWAAHCARTCAALSVPLTVSQVQVALGSGDGPEAAARRARHAAFEAGLAADETLALAHHRDDQAETFLLRALRASGPDGLAAMRRWRDCGHGRLWRPLLDLPRAALEAYAREHALQWIEDPSNADDAYDRNFLRTRVLPLLRERWPQADAALAASAALNAQAATLLQQDDALALASVRSADPQALSRADLRALAPARRARVLRHWIAELGLPPLPAQGVARIDAELLDARDDAEAEFAWSGAVVRAWRDLLHAQAQSPALPSHWHSPWDGRAPLALPGGGELRLEGANALDGACVVHARAGGERIALPGRAHRHSLKHTLQTLGVPPWERRRLPLLSCDGVLLAVADLAYSADFEPWLRERGARLVWRP